MRAAFELRALSDVGVALLDCEHRTPNACQTGWPYIAITDLHDGRVDTSNARLISDEDLADWTRKTRPQAGDVIVTRRGRVGDTAVVPHDLTCALGQNLVLLRSDGRHVLQSYLRWAVRGAPFTKDAQTYLNVGAVFDSLNCGDIPKFRIPLPSMRAQQQIAGILESVDDKIESNRRICETLEQIAEAVFRSRFVEFDDAGELVASEIGWIPRGWRPGRVLDVANVVMGQSPPSSSYVLDPEAGPMLVQGMGAFGQRFPKSDRYCTVPRKTAAPGDLLLTVRAPVGELNVCREPVCLGRGVAGLRSQWPGWLEFALRASVGEWAAMETGTIFTAVNGGQVETFPLVLPAPSDLDEYEAFVQPIRLRLETLHRENLTLVTLRDTLLPRLISGEIRVPVDVDAGEVA